MNSNVGKQGYRVLSKTHKNKSLYSLVLPMDNLIMKPQLLTINMFEIYELY